MIPNQMTSIPSIDSLHSNPPANNLPVVSRSTPELFSLSQRTILVTGGGRGLGLTVAQAVLESGGDVICVDLLPEPDQKHWNVVNTTARKYGTSLIYWQADVTDPEALQAIFDEAIAICRYPLRGVVAAAGIMVMEDAINYPLATFKRVMTVNVDGCFLTSQAAARAFAQQGITGSIVLVSSMSGTVANRGIHASAYNISKSAVLQMARSLAAEWSPGTNNPSVRINTLSPGYIRTTMTDNMLAQKGGEMEKQWCDGAMLGRIATPDEFKAPVVFLLSDGSSFMTGADLRVDGGHCAW